MGRYKDLIGQKFGKLIVIALDEFADYKKYKEEFISTGSSSAKDMSKQELGHFLMNLKDMFKELNENSKDDIEERSMVKSTIKEIYQLFI